MATAEPFETRAKIHNSRHDECYRAAVFIPDTLARHILAQVVE